DGYGHVNNAVYLTYLEEARDEWLQAILGPAGGADDYVVAHLSIDFREELRQSDDSISVRSALERIGTSSLRTRETIVKRDGRIAAEAEVVLVMRDRTTLKSRPLAAAERRALEQAMEPRPPARSSRRSGRRTPHRGRR
ncbi:MAG TPA: thioesterase family protein, partial [Candidatus Polarisedimenticolia bacterium]|nr:thioesterase family protein [Candidatus Polarisedimenticolia bacterium]